MVRIPYSLGFKIYKKSPSWLRSIMDIGLKPIPRSFMLGSGFHEKLKFLLESQKWSYEELTKFQEKAFRALIDHAYKNVPYYHKIFKERNLYPSDIRKIEDLKKLPILTQDDIRNNFSQLTALNYKKFKPGLAYTSGSTGKPLEFYLDQQNREWEYASQWRQAFWGGIKDLNVRIASFRRDELVFKYGKEITLWKYNGLTKRLVFNVYQLTPDNVRVIIKKLNEFRPSIIEGFPHSLYIVAKYALEEGLDITFKPQFILALRRYNPI